MKCPICETETNEKVCPNCGSEIRMDEWGVYCTKCKWIGE